MTKVDRADLLETRNRNPCATLQELGDKYGVSREGIRQILVKEGKSTVGFIQRYNCNQCGKDVGTNPNKLYCSQNCRSKSAYVEIPCSYCGKLFNRRAKVIVNDVVVGRKNVGYFCSKVCYGKWFGETHGFAVHPENSCGGRHGGRRWGRKRKWNRGLVLHLQRETGFGCNRLSRLTGVPVGTISVILKIARSG